MRAEKILTNPPGVLGWVGVDAPKARDALAKYSWCSAGVILKTVDSVLRGVAQVIFVNNPASGLLMLLGLLLGDLKAGIGAIICSLVAILVAKLLQMGDDVVCSGVSNFSAVLVGTVTASLFTPFFQAPLSPSVWALMLLAAAFSVLVLAGLGSLLGRHQIPAYTLPFNVAASVIFLSMRAAGYAAPSPDHPDNHTITHDTDFVIEWHKVWLGTLLSVGQVWAVESVTCSVLILLGTALCSPLLTLALYAGGAIGTFTSLVVSSAPYSNVYAGVWGYNGFLAGGAIAFFMVPTPRMLLLAAVNAVFATFLQAALIPVFASNQLPVFTFPFCLASVLILAAAMVASPQHRVAAPSTPELHILHHIQSSEAKGRGRDDKDDDGSLTSPV